MSNTAPKGTVARAASGVGGAGLRPAGADAGQGREATRTVGLSAPWIDERDEELVLETLRSGWLSLGPTGPRFEQLLAEKIGARHCAAVSSGTAALHLAMRLAGVGPGDEVITSPFSFVASANCAIYEGATPVFAEIDERTYNLDPDAVEAAITERTKAIVAVDIFGYPCELDPLLALCEWHGLKLVQDACEALGARYKGRLLGSHGHPTTFAFYPNKQMTTGEGGALTTNDEREYELLDSLRNQGRLEKSSWLLHGRLGYNYRLDDISAALGIGQVERLDEILAARSEVAGRYAALLKGVDVEPPLADDDDHVRSWFVYVVRLPRGADRDAISAAMRERGVGRRRTSPRSTFSRTCASATASAKACCPSRRTAARGRSRFRSTAVSRARTRSTSSRCSEQRCRRADPRAARGVDPLRRGRARHSRHLFARPGERALPRQRLGDRGRRRPRSRLSRLLDGARGDRGARRRRARPAGGRRRAALRGRRAPGRCRPGEPRREVDQRRARARRRPRGGAHARSRAGGDRATRRQVRLAVAAVLTVCAIPWLAAELGFHFGAGIFLTGQLRTVPGDPVPHPAVHLGHHHGLDGFLLVMTALLLSRVRSERKAAGVLLAMLASYGFVNLVQDAWGEQAVKRGWTSRQIPSALHPSLSWVWLVILGGAVALWPLVARR